MKMKFGATAYRDFLWWEKHDPKKFGRIKALCNAISDDPFHGIGKPEPLKHELQGRWSRRIDHTHRLVYFVEGETVTIASCKFHY